MDDQQVKQLAESVLRTENTTAQQPSPSEQLPIETPKKTKIFRLVAFFAVLGVAVAAVGYFSQKQATTNQRAPSLLAHFQKKIRERSSNTPNKLPASRHTFSLSVKPKLAELTEQEKQELGDIEEIQAAGDFEILPDGLWLNVRIIADKLDTKLEVKYLSSKDELYFKVSGSESWQKTVDNNEEYRYAIGSLQTVSKSIEGRWFFVSGVSRLLSQSGSTLPVDALVSFYVQLLLPKEKRADGTVNNKPAHGLEVVINGKSVADFVEAFETANKKMQTSGVTDTEVLPSSTRNQIEAYDFEKQPLQFFLDKSMNGNSRLEYDGEIQKNATATVSLETVFTEDPKALTAPENPASVLELIGTVTKELRELEKSFPNTLPTQIRSL
jgi:hypothetical protein